MLQFWLCGKKRKTENKKETLEILKTFRGKYNIKHNLYKKFKIKYIYSIIEEKILGKEYQIWDWLVLIKEHKSVKPYW